MEWYLEDRHCQRISKRQVKNSDDLGEEAKAMLGWQRNMAHSTRVRQKI